ncbi:MAG TPA: glycosyltransferase family A protein [Thermoanaerobaculia bacterium]|nr:glycosyltransferase family A protein [Thermoanaerobaculia bacterium]
MSRHLVVVEAYDGVIELLSADPAEQRAARGLGLPLAELAEALEARFTVLTWDAWKRTETHFGSPFTWDHVAATRPVAPPPSPAEPPDWGSEVLWREVPARVPGQRPDRDLPLHEIRESPPALGLIAGNDLLFLLSWQLNEELARLFQADPFLAVLVPQWGGLGYLPMMARATGIAGFEAPFAVVVTDVSAHRQEANQEGLWTRPAQVRRQAEDLSLALADLALVFGPRGEALARAGRLPDAAPPVRAPRRVEAGVLERIAAAAGTPARGGDVQVFLDEPQDGSSGVLAALDAARHLAVPMISAGPSMLFAPMKRPFEDYSFEDYWGSRGWVRELIAAGRWAWRDRPQGDTLPLRLFPSRFEHLPDVWSELARGSAVLLSPAAAEGLVPGEEPPPEALLGGEPDPERLAARLAAVLETGGAEIDRARRELCRRVVAAHRGEARRQLLDGTAEALRGLIAGQEPQDLGRAAALLLDRTRPLGEMASPKIFVGEGLVPSLTVVIPCYEMGAMLAETVESVWASERRPDEVIVVDDGSRDEATRACLADLQREAAGRGLPLTVLRQSNRGLAGARNAGLAAARSAFISCLDGDDLVAPAFYRLALDLLERSPGLGGVAAFSVCFGPEGPVGFWNPPQPELPFLFVENCVFVPCVTRTALLRSLGGYDTGQRFNYEDWELAVRLLAAGWPIVTIPAYLARYRVRPDSLLRTLTPVQNQTMRERLLATHRETASRFAVEIAMQIEHRWKTLEAATGGAAAGGGAGWRKAARRVLALARKRGRTAR